MLLNRAVDCTLSALIVVVLLAANSSVALGENRLPHAKRAANDRGFALYSAVSNPIALPARDRSAEIWMKFPRDTNPSVAVNFTEYPPAGDFRIFRTTIPDDRGRKYYISAVQRTESGNNFPLDPKGPWIRDDALDLHYVLLKPGETAKIEFGSAGATAAGPRVPAADTIDGLKKEIQDKIIQLEEKAREEERKKAEVAQKQCEQEKEKLCKANAELVEKNAELEKQLEAARKQPLLPGINSVATFRFAEPLKRTALVERGEDGTILRLGFLPAPQELTIVSEYWPWGADSAPADVEIVFVLVDAEHPAKLAPIADFTASMTIRVTPDGANLKIVVPFRNSLKDYFGISSMLAGQNPGEKIHIRAFLKLKTKQGQEHSVWPVGNLLELTLEDAE
jgi:hypothetical protein